MSSTSRRRATALVVAALGAAALSAGTASASTPSYARCPVASPNVVECIFVQSTAGSLSANRNSINLRESITVEGGVAQDPVTAATSFVPPVSGPALTGTPVPVASAQLGLPASYQTITATVQQVGPLAFDDGTLDITAPIRVRFNNALLGPNCAIGSATSPITLNLTTGTTNPPAPNTPISGSIGDILFPSTPAGTFNEYANNVHVDNAYAVPAATSCGVAAQATVTKAINKALGLPSAAGTNTATLTDNVFVGFPA